MLAREQRWFFASVAAYLLLMVVVSIVALGVLVSRGPRPVSGAWLDAAPRVADRPAD